MKEKTGKLVKIIGLVYFVGSSALFTFGILISLYYSIAVKIGETGTPFYTQLNLAIGILLFLIFIIILVLEIIFVTFKQKSINEEKIINSDAVNNEGKDKQEKKPCIIKFL